LDRVNDNFTYSDDRDRDPRTQQATDQILSNTRQVAEIAAEDLEKHGHTLNGIPRDVDIFAVSALAPSAGEALKLIAGRREISGIAVALIVPITQVGGKSVMAAYEQWNNPDREMLVDEAYLALSSHDEHSSHEEGLRIGESLSDTGIHVRRSVNETANHANTAAHNILNPQQASRTFELSRRYSL